MSSQADKAGLTIKSRSSSTTTTTTLGISERAAYPNSTPLTHGSNTNLWASCSAYKLDVIGFLKVSASVCMQSPVQNNFCSISRSCLFWCVLVINNNF